MPRHRLDMREHRLALPGRPAHAVDGLEQSPTQRTLDPRQPPPDCRLVDAQPLTGAGVGTLVADRRNDAKIVPIHASEIPRSLRYLQ